MLKQTIERLLTVFTILTYCYPIVADPQPSYRHEPHLPAISAADHPAHFWFNASPKNICELALIKDVYDLNSGKPKVDAANVMLWFWQGEDHKIQVQDFAARAPHFLGGVYRGQASLIENNLGVTLKFRAKPIFADRQRYIYNLNVSGNSRHGPAEFALYCHDLNKNNLSESAVSDELLSMLAIHESLFLRYLNPIKNTTPL